MILPDVNVLLYAFRSDAEHHSEYKAWLEGVINGPAAYGMAPQVLGTVVRICTHPRIFARPSSRDVVFNFCRVLLEHPNATVITPGERPWSIFGHVCRQSQSHRKSRSGSLVCRARDRIRDRLDNNRWRPCSVRRADLACALLAVVRGIASADNHSAGHRARRLTRALALSDQPQPDRRQAEVSAR